MNTTTPTTKCPNCSLENQIDFITVHENKESCTHCFNTYTFTKKQEQENKVQHSKQILREIINHKKGIVIFQTSVSKSGMSRAVSIYNHDLSAWLTYHVANVLGYTVDKNDKLKISGCGMDMHFWIADALTHALYTKAEQKKLAGNGQGCLPWKSIF